jgi:hypothetical protein
MDEVDESEEDEITATWSNILWAAFVPFLLATMGMYIFLFGVSIGPKATNAWLLGSGISLLESIFILEPLSILFYHVLIASVTYEQVVSICNRLRNRAKYFLRRVKNQMPGPICLIQHFNPACRAARRMPDLPISRLLISLNDYDFNLDQSIGRKIREKGAFGFVLSLLVGIETVLLLIFTSLPEIVQSNLMDMFISAGFNFILLGLYIFGVAVGIAGPVVLIALLIFALVIYVILVTGTLDGKCSSSSQKGSNDVEVGVSKLSSDEYWGSVEMIKSSGPEQVNDGVLQSLPKRPIPRLASAGMLGSSQHWMMSSARWKVPRSDFSYVIVRFAGGFVRNAPDDSGRTVKRYKLDELVIIESAALDESSKLWLECTDGWIAALTEGGNRVLIPGNTAAPISARTISTTLVPSEGNAWLAAEDMDLKIELELEFSSGGTIRLLRSYSDFLDLFEVLLKYHSSKNTEVSPTRLQVHDVMNFESLDERGVLKFVDFLDIWMRENICQIDTPLSVISEFIRPTGRDIEFMENTLLGENSNDAPSGVSNAPNDAIQHSALVKVVGHSEYDRTQV